MGSVDSWWLGHGKPLNTRADSGKAEDALQRCDEPFGGGFPHDQLMGPKAGGSLVAGLDNLLGSHSSSPAKPEESVKTGEGERCDVFKIRRWCQEQILSAALRPLGTRLSCRPKTR
jgi:hypothetical protein